MEVSDMWKEYIAQIVKPYLDVKRENESSISEEGGIICTIKPLKLSNKSSFNYNTSNIFITKHGSLQDHIKILQRRNNILVGNAKNPSSQIHI